MKGYTQKFIKRILPIALLLCGLSTGLYYYQHLQHFEQQRSSVGQNEEKMLSTAIVRSEQELKQLSSVIQSLEGVNRSLFSGKSQQLKKAFGPHWANMQYDWSLDIVAFHNDKNEPLGQWSTHPQEEKLKQQITSWTEQVLSTKKPLRKTSCLETCSQYYISPIVIDGMEKGIMLLATSLHDWLYQFELSTGVAVGLLTPALSNKDSVDILTNKWGLEVYQLTDLKNNKPILEKFSKIFSPAKNVVQTTSSTIDQRTIELNFFPMTEAGESFLIFLEDISSLKARMIYSTIIFSAFSFFTFILLQTVLLFSPKLSRFSEDRGMELIDTVTITSSDLTESDPTLKEIKQLTNTDTPVDFDLTSNDIMPLSGHLQQLKKYNPDINTQMVSQMMLLGKERDQVRAILDNTQAIILTIHENGSIASINRFGEMITGFSAKELIGKNFVSIGHGKTPFAETNLKKLKELANGQQGSYRHETTISCKDGVQRTILWLHSRLADNNSPLLLSAGLDITDQKQLEKNLSWLAGHDSLTSLYNRRQFKKELIEAIQWAKEHETMGALLYIDLDYFKDINDSCGHQTGDVILRKVADKLRKIVSSRSDGENAIAARLGGDEFAIILHKIGKKASVKLARKILRELHKIKHTDEYFQIQISCSVGIARFPAGESDPEELLSNADVAMYQSKALGRNQFYVFNEKDGNRKSTHYRLVWKERLENALRKGRFILHYQPIMDIQRRSISHYETLIRMIDDDENIISPGIFINIAKKLGMLQKIDTFMLQSAIKKQAELSRQGHDITLTINLSGKAFDDPELSSLIEGLIIENNAKPGNLIFEITETTAVSDIVSAEKIMRKIQALGCQFALDDFGKGFSSFYYLRELPVEYVKIDGLFVRDLPNNTDNEILVKALSKVAIGFNKLTVAEFVDSFQTLQILEEAKVNFAQGYFIGKPSEHIPVSPPDFYQAALHENNPIL